MILDISACSDCPSLRDKSFETGEKLICVIYDACHNGEYLIIDDFHVIHAKCPLKYRELKLR